MKANQFIMGLLTCLSLLHVSPVFAENPEATQAAGPGSGNGGNVVRNETATKFSDLVRKASKIPFTPKSRRAYQTLIYTLDKNPGYFEATVLQPLVRFSKTPKARVLESLNRLQFLLINEPLPPLNDTGIFIYMHEFKGELKRFALQYRTTGQVIVDMNLLEELLKNDEAEVGVAAFFLHEALIRVFNDGDYSAQLKSTEIISSIVNVTFGKNKIVAQLGPEDLAQMLTQTGIPTTHRTLPELEVIPMTRASMATPMQFAKFFVHFQDSGTVKFCTGDYGGRPALDKYLNSKLPSPQLYLDTRCFTSDDSRMMNGVFSFSQSMRMGQYLADSLLIVAPDNSGVTHYGHHTDPAYAGPNNISLWKEMTK